MRGLRCFLRRARARSFDGAGDPGEGRCCALGDSEAAAGPGRGFLRGGFCGESAGLGGLKLGLELGLELGEELGEEGGLAEGEEGAAGGEARGGLFWGFFW